MLAPEGIVMAAKPKVKLSSPTATVPPDSGRSPRRPRRSAAMPTVPSSVMTPLSRTSAISSHRTWAPATPVGSWRSPGVTVQSVGSRKNSSPSYEIWPTLRDSPSKMMRPSSPSNAYRSLTDSRSKVKLASRSPDTASVPPTAVTVEGSPLGPGPPPAAGGCDPCADTAGLGTMRAASPIVTTATVTKAAPRTAADLNQSGMFGVIVRGERPSPQGRPATAHGPPEHDSAAGNVERGGDARDRYDDRRAAARAVVRVVPGPAPGVGVDHPGDLHDRGVRVHADLGAVLVGDPVRARGPGSRGCRQGGGRAEPAAAGALRRLHRRP